MFYHRDRRTGRHLLTHRGETFQFESRAAAIAAAREILAARATAKARAAAEARPRLDLGVDLGLPELRA